MTVGSQIDLANVSFSVARWAKRVRRATEFLVSQGVGGATTLLNFGFRDDVSTGTQKNLVLCDFYGDDLEVEVPFDTNWHHWVCTYDSDANTQTLYRDGVQVKQRVAANDYKGHGDLFVGRYAGRLSLRGAH